MRRNMTIEAFGLLVSELKDREVASSNCGQETTDVNPLKT